MKTEHAESVDALTVVGPTETDCREIRHQTERPPPQREGIVSDPDQYFPNVPAPATVTPPGRQVISPTNPDF